MVGSYLLHGTGTKRIEKRDYHIGPETFNNLKVVFLTC
jgi:hypothetical protein